eukprot:1739792-Lingulodinium_polyedra.AAC.1
MHASATGANRNLGARTRMQQGKPAATAGHMVRLALAHGNSLGAKRAKKDRGAPRRRRSRRIGRTR